MAEVYADEEIEAAIERIARDVHRRLGLIEFAGVEMTAVVAGLQQIQAARLAGDRPAAATAARQIEPGLDAYRPTNSTSRAKAILLEVTRRLIADDEPAPA